MFMLAVRLRVDWCEICYCKYSVQYFDNRWVDFCFVFEKSFWFVCLFVGTVLRTVNKSAPFAPYWSVRGLFFATILHVEVGRIGPFFTVGVRSGIVAPASSVKKRPTRRAQIRQGMSYKRLAKTDLVGNPPGEEEGDGATGGEEPGKLDLSSLYRLLKQSMQNQEREMAKQEQRWRSVQVQINNVRDELEMERRTDSRQHRGAEVLPPAPAELPVLAAAPAAGPSSAVSPAPPPIAPQAALSPGLVGAPSSVPPAAGPASVPPTTVPAAPPAAPWLSWMPPAAPWMPAAPPAAHLYPAPGPAAPATSSWTRAAVPKLEEGDDVEQYLTTFERLAMAYRWPPADWAIFLVPYLTGRARAAYVAMDPYDAMDYGKVKDAILAKYEISTEVYRQRFRDPDLQPGETPREFYNRLKDLFQKWIKPAAKTVEEMAEILILEQFLHSLSPEVCVWVKEHSPHTGLQAAELVDSFMAARRGPKDFRFHNSSRTVMKGKSGGYGTGPGNSGQSRGPSTRPSIPPQHTQPRPTPTPSATPPMSRDSRLCHYCNKPGHFIRECPVKKAEGMCSVPRPMREPVCTGNVQIIDVVVNGRPARALLDTGSTQTLVQPHLVDQPGSLTGECLRVCCVNGDEHEYPIADILLRVREQTYKLRAGIVKGLSHPVVLGQDVLILPELVQSTLPVSMAATRSQTKRALTEEPDSRELLSAMPFSNVDIQPPETVRVRKSRRQRRHAKLLGTVEAMSRSDSDAPPCVGEDVLQVPSDFRELQQNDETLRELFNQAADIDEGSVVLSSGEGYFVREGLLYHKPEGGSTEQLVIPGSLRQQVLSLGHDIPWAGHMGNVKTLQRISSKFFWPGMYTDIHRHCKTCPTCQLASKHKVKPFPLQPLPVIDVPFTRIGMDIVGPLERTQTGHQYILVVCDYATRFPEAFPLRKVTARTIAPAILQLFSRVGIPQEILTDQGTAFLSNTLKQVYGLLGIKGIRTTPYHPQTDGLVERYNQTLKNMLRKFVAVNGKDWDRWLPYLMFAYREVPQASTGFSPFELLYGRQVRGPLDLLRDAWETPKSTTPTNILTYVIALREKMEEMSTMVRENLLQAQDTQTRWYDKSARQRSFQPGQKVLLLLPTQENKLLAKWQGPYSISQKLGPTTYELEMPDKRKPRQVYHINLLKEWHEREVPLNQQLLVQAVKEEDDTPEQFFPTNRPNGELDFTHLSLQQQQELRAVIPDGLFCDQPGRTDLAEHNIRLKDPTPSRQRMYRVPERLLPALQEELQVMQRMGVIERSESAWSSPVVLVPKKDGTMRFCIDFRQVNAQSDFDAYPMPRLEDLIERLGKALFITTLDLSKGYWQVPLAKEARPCTAFRTPQGLFQFTVMPFGLQGAPATFQRLVDRVLEGTGAFADAYLDDIVIFSATWDEHVRHLAEVLRRIHQAGLTVQPKKCAFAQPEVRYLGHIVGHGVIRPQKDKIEAIRNCPRPQTKKDVRSFLGLAGWYRRFVPNFATRAAPLTDLTRKSGSVRVRWEEQHEKAFMDLKEVLCSDLVLQSPDFQQPLTVQTDASGVGLGAVLLQGQGDQQRPVAYISRKLFPRETRYSAVELECLAVKWALDTFRYYLLGRDFSLETDHRALKWLGKMKDTNARITRWFLALQPFRFQVQYRQGKQNVVADFLSRHPSVEPPEGGGNVKRQPRLSPNPADTVRDI